ncbi:phosphatases II [Myriangium duriaei CBS 260.36]|uniref:phosphatidylinositol-3,4,5-trisphosphate 3-phosphatase n=1 Tax=Myriangium duriaei CBS 260.36 TaxID=1168546 RepID=A0A9P4J735_9PEZI|nr:phosphatases II [Myriangium duriaei CBS 260.36]
MASLLRQIVAGPRARHPEAGLDLCYVTDNIIATSGPSGTYPQLAYRNPLKQLVKFLDEKHGDQWAIWEFRAEGTGYPDSEVYNRIYHYPWPDHHPPPFALIPLITASMRNWLKGDAPQIESVVVVHCKAGKGRSGTASCSYLISQEGWTVQSALQRFTERRMRPGFGAGVSIPSQLRWVSYVDRWTRNGKKYVERPVQITEVHVWGLRDRVKISICGFKDEGRKIEIAHTFTKEEREIVRGDGTQKAPGFAGVVSDVMLQEKARRDKTKNNSADPSVTGKDAVDQAVDEESRRSSKTTPENLAEEGAAGDVVFRPKEKIIVDTNDVNIDFERRNKGVSNLSMITSVAHVWFNTFFEGDGPESNGVPRDTGVFEIEWDRMDGIKGSSRKGTRAFDKLAVVWRAVTHAPGKEIREPGAGEGIQDSQAADWTGKQQSSDERDIGAKVESASTLELDKEGSRPGSAGTK